MSAIREIATTAMANMLKADTTVLYGTSKLLQKIEPSAVRYSNAGLDISAPYGLFLWCENVQTLETHSQNVDEIYEIGLRFETIDNDTQGAITKIENAYNRVKYLSNSQMWQGLYLTQYYSESKSQVFNIDTTDSNFNPSVVETGNILVVEIETAIMLYINSWR